MRLNLTILKDYLKLDVQSANVGDPYDFKLERAEFWTPNSTANEKTLYICDAVAPDFRKNPRLSLIFLHELPQKIPSTLGYLHLAPNANPIEVCNKVIEVFSYFTTWDTQLLEVYGDRYSLQSFLDIAHEPFGNDLTLVDPNFLTMAHSYAPERGPHPEIYGTSNYCYPERFLELIETDLEFRKSYNDRLPRIIAQDWNPMPTLYYNIYDGDLRLGQLTVDETIRPIRQSDYSLLYHIGKYAKMIMLRWDILELGKRNALFEDTLRMLLDGNAIEQRELDRRIASSGWRSSDRYRCAKVELQGDMANREISVSQLLFRIHYNFDEIAVIRETGDIDMYLLFNISRSKTEQRPLAESLAPILANYECKCGLSDAFTGIDNIEARMKQATAALLAGKAIDPSLPVYSFTHFALDILLYEGTKGIGCNLARTDRVVNLMEYDRVNNSELCLTLKTYLQCNCTAAKATNILHLNKTTFYYRLNRISEITGYDLDDYRTRLFLANLAELGLY